MIEIRSAKMKSSRNHLLTRHTDGTIPVYHSFGKKSQRMFHCICILFLMGSCVTSNYIEAPNSGISVANRNQKLKAGLLTPYALTPGGGERYFLTGAYAFLKLGYDVDIIVHDDNHCKSTDCVEQTLVALRIPMKIEQVHIRVLSIIGMEMENQRYEIPEINHREYDVFFVMANHKLPRYSAKGVVNIFMCQFPFDYYDEKSTKTYIDSFSDFDQIIVNSRFTHDWYIRSVRSGAQYLVQNRRPLPTVSVIHPPVQPFPVNVSTKLPMPHPEANFVSMKSLFSKISSSKSGKKTELVDSGSKTKTNEKVNIALCGRFFKGRQSKGHDNALKFLQRLSTLMQRPLHLYLIGFVHPDNESADYVEDLRRQATEWGLSTTFLLNAEVYEVSAALSKSLIYWHLTGANLLSSRAIQDPASFEHFGIAIVEAMYCGCIPIVTSLGGVTDIVTHNFNGMLADSEADFIVHTMTLLTYPADELTRLRQNAIDSASRFSLKFFTASFQSMVSRVTRSAEYRRITTTRHDQLPVPSSAFRSKQVVVFIESGISTNLRACVSNVMQYVGPLWKVHVFVSHDSGSDAITADLLKRFRVTYVKLVAPILTSRDYDSLLKSAWFWDHFMPDERILLVNENSVLLRKGIEDFLQYDFISAPLLYDKLNDKRVVSEDAMVLSDAALDYSTLYEKGAGHAAGVSLRRAGAMQSIIKAVGSSGSSLDEPEGVFFARYARKMGFKIANNYTSYKFAWEAELPELGGPIGSAIERPPVALHAAWLYMRPPVVTGLINRNIIDTIHVSVSIFPKRKKEVIKFLIDGNQDRIEAKQEAEAAEAAAASAKFSAESETETETDKDSKAEKAESGDSAESESETDAAEVIQAEVGVRVGDTGVVESSRPASLRGNKKGKSNPGAKTSQNRTHKKVPNSKNSEGETEQAANESESVASTAPTSRTADASADGGPASTSPPAKAKPATVRTAAKAANNKSVLPTAVNNKRSSTAAVGTSTPVSPPRAHDEPSKEIEKTDSSEPAEKSESSKLVEPTEQSENTAKQPSNPNIHLDGKSKESYHFWKFIHNPAVLIGGELTQMKELLDQLGVTSMLDLSLLEESHFQQIKELVKPVQRQKVMSILFHHKKDVR